MPIPMINSADLPAWAALIIAAGCVAVCLTLLFLLVFPLLNRFAGTDFPCRDFKSVKRAKTRAPGVADTSWVPTVALPETTGQPPDLKPSRIRLPRR